MKTHEQQALPPQTEEPRRIKTRWEELTRNLDSRAKDFQYKRIEILLDLLREAPTDVVEAELERLRSSSVKYADMSEYDKTLLQTLVARLFEEGNGKRLINLLSGKCPASVGFRPIESAVTFKTIDGILWLFDSYENATNEDARSIILAALGSAFRDIRRVTKDDGEFINASRKWFTANRTRIKVNPNYSRYHYTNDNLFVLIK